MKVKKIATKLALVLLFTTISSQAFAQEPGNKDGANFSDVSPNHWAYHALQKLAEKYDFKLGYPDGTFGGNKSLTRYEMAAIIVKILDQVKENKVVIKKDDKESLKELARAFQKDIEQQGEKLSAIEDQLDMVETKNQEIEDTLNGFMASQPFKFFGSVAFRVDTYTNDFDTRDLKFLRKETIPFAKISFGLKSQGFKNLDFGIRGDTGGEKWIAFSWWKMGDFFARFPFTIDRYFLTYRPIENLSLTLGRFQDPYSNSELFFDEEMSPSGAMQKLKFENIGGTFFKEFSLIAGETVVINHPLFGSTWMFSGKSDLKFNIADFADLNLSGAYHHYVGEDDISKANDVAKKNGLGPRIEGFAPLTNTLDTDGGFKYNFHIANAFAGLVLFKDAFMPLTVSADYLYNLGAPLDNQAYQISANLGKMMEAGNFFIRYNYKVMQKDANISYFIEDQMVTDAIAHEGQIGVKLADKTSLSFTAQYRIGIKDVGKPLYTIRTTLWQNF
jgi:hypothetical protein